MGVLLRQNHRLLASGEGISKCATSLEIKINKKGECGPSMTYGFECEPVTTPMVCLALMWRSWQAAGGASLGRRQRQTPPMADRVVILRTITKQCNPLI